MGEELSWESEEVEEVGGERAGELGGESGGVVGEEDSGDIGKLAGGRGGGGGGGGDVSEGVESLANFPEFVNSNCEGKAMGGGGAACDGGINGASDILSLISWKDFSISDNIEVPCPLFIVDVGENA